MATQEKSPVKPSVTKEQGQHVNRKQVIADNNFKLSKFSNVESKVKPMMQDKKKEEKKAEKEGEKGAEQTKQK